MVSLRPKFFIRVVRRYSVAGKRGQRSRGSRRRKHPTHRFVVVCRYVHVLGGEQTTKELKQITHELAIDRVSIVPSGNSTVRLTAIPLAASQSNGSMRDLLELRCQIGCDCMPDNKCHCDKQVVWLREDNALHPVGDELIIGVFNHRRLAKLAFRALSDGGKKKAKAKKPRPAAPRGSLFIALAKRDGHHVQSLRMGGRFAKWQISMIAGSSGVTIWHNGQRVGVATAEQGVDIKDALTVTSVCVFGNRAEATAWAQAHQEVLNQTRLDQLAFLREMAG